MPPRNIAKFVEAYRKLMPGIDPANAHQPVVIARALGVSERTAGQVARALGTSAPISDDVILQRIAQAMESSRAGVTKTGGLAYMPQVREALADILPGTQFDEAVMRLRRAQRIQIQPHPTPGQLTPQERAAMVFEKTPEVNPLGRRGDVLDGRPAGDYHMAIGLRNKLALAGVGVASGTAQASGGSAAEAEPTLSIGEADPRISLASGYGNVPEHELAANTLNALGMMVPLPNVRAARVVRGFMRGLAGR